jgi:hypothetical protein
MQLGRLYILKTEHGGMLLYPTLECARYVRSVFDDHQHTASRYWSKMLHTAFKLTGAISYIPNATLFVCLGERDGDFHKVLASDGTTGWIIAGQYAMTCGIISPANDRILSPKKTTTEQT